MPRVACTIQLAILVFPPLVNPTVWHPHVIPTFLYTFLFSFPFCTFSHLFLIFFSSFSLPLCISKPIELSHWFPSAGRALKYLNEWRVEMKVEEGGRRLLASQGESEVDTFNFLFFPLSSLLDFPNKRTSPSSVPSSRSFVERDRTYHQNIRLVHEDPLPHVNEAEISLLDK